MKKLPKYIKLILILISSVNAYNQQVIDSTYLKCQYKLDYKQRSTDSILDEDVFIVQIGKNTTKCFSYYTFQCDSLKSLPDGDILWKESFKRAFSEAKGGIPTGFYYRRSKEFIYKNYIENKMTVVDGISFDDYIYEDSIYAQKWQILSDTTTILGYVCQKASCTFRGRKYIAWFTNSIPVSEGPWKFMGLPGLIVKVFDNDNTFTFTLQEIAQTKETIVFSPSMSPSGKFIKTKREKFLTLNNKFLENSQTYMEAETGLGIFSDVPESESNVNILELE